MNDLQTLAKVVLAMGIVLAAAGGGLWLLGRTGVPLGRLPGDLHFEIGGVSCFVPLATSIVLSLVLTIVLNLIVRMRR
jgi:hypothetical protein